MFIQFVFRGCTNLRNSPFNKRDRGRCPNAFSLALAKDMGMVDSRDNNGDGWVCIMTNGNGSTIVIDNNHRTSGMI
jgi:hypothetical protein